MENNMAVLKEGKLSNDFLKKNIIDKINKNLHANEILIASGIGEDCAVMDFGAELCVVSTDPITGADKNVGTIAVDVSCNDIASNGIRPFALLVTILAPVNSTEEDLIDIFTQINKRANKLKVRIIGGHTEVTSSVNKFVISTTAFGKASDENMVVSSKAQVGDDIIVTSNIGIEGTYIIANDKLDICETFLSREELEEISTYGEKLSVVDEGCLLSEIGVSSMHDITEGGVFGAAWELATASNLSCTLYVEKIPCSKITKRLCEHFKINPYRLISSGSMIATICDGEKAKKVLNEKGIICEVIGKITDDNQNYLYYESQNRKEILEPPSTDELFKI